MSDRIRAGRLPRYSWLPVDQTSAKRIARIGDVAHHTSCLSGAPNRSPHGDCARYGQSSSSDQPRADWSMTIVPLSTETSTVRLRRAALHRRPIPSHTELLPHFETCVNGISTLNTLTRRANQGAVR